MKLSMLTAATVHSLKNHVDSFLVQLLVLISSINSHIKPVGSVSGSQAVFLSMWSSVSALLLLSVTSAAQVCIMYRLISQGTINIYSVHLPDICAPITGTPYCFVKLCRPKQLQSSRTDHRSWPSIRPLHPSRPCTLFTPVIP
jgi:hypothetical protein